MVEQEWFKFENDFGKEKTCVTLEIKKFNKNNQFCYFDNIDLTNKDVSEGNLTLFCNLFNRAGFETEIKTYTYFGIYDPSRMAQLIELSPTDEQLLEKRLLYAR